MLLAPGQEAAARLGFVFSSLLPPSQCRPVGVVGVRVYPPGQATALFTHLVGRACSATGAGQLTVTPIHAGRSL